MMIKFIIFINLILQTSLKTKLKWSAFSMPIVTWRSLGHRRYLPTDLPGSYIIIAHLNI